MLFYQRLILFETIPAHPHRDRLPHTLFEGCCKSAVTPETALLSQLLGSERAIGSDSLLIETHEVLDAQAIDIGIVGAHPYPGLFHQHE